MLTINNLSGLVDRAFLCRISEFLKVVKNISFLSEDLKVQKWSDSGFKSGRVKNKSGEPNSFLT